MKELEQTIALEIKRLWEKAQQSPLDADDTNKLVKITSALKNYQSSPLPEVQEDYDDMPLEELLALAKADVEVYDGD